MHLFYLPCVFGAALTISLQLRPVESVQKVDEACSGTQYTACVFNYTTLKLWCDSTNFTSIPKPDSIKAYLDPSLTRALYINSSCLENIKPDVLCLYQRLVVLNFDNNFITKVYNATFRKCQSLQNLVLSRNKISHIEDGAFRDLAKLRILSLSNNDLESISREMFANLHTVEQLRLDHNKLTSIEENAFSDMEKLLKLDLSGNKLTRIAWGETTVFPQLQLLKFNNNQLQEFDARELRIFTDLTKLDLSSNNLSCIITGSLSSKRSLTTILLHDNQLQVPPSDWFRKVYKEKQLTSYVASPLSNNPWTCGCEAYDYWEFLKQGDVQRYWRRHLDLECTAPRKHKGRILSSLTKEAFADCSKDKEYSHQCPRTRHITPKNIIPGPGESSKQKNELQTTKSPWFISFIVLVGLIVVVVFFVLIYRRCFSRSPTHETKQTAAANGNQFPPGNRISDYIEADTPLFPKSATELSHHPSADYESVCSVNSCRSPSSTFLAGDSSSSTQPKTTRRPRYDSGYSDGQRYSRQDTISSQADSPPYPMDPLEECSTENYPRFVQSVSEATIAQNHPSLCGHRCMTVPQFPQQPVNRGYPVIPQAHPNTAMPHPCQRSNSTCFHCGSSVLAPSAPNWNGPVA